MSDEDSWREPETCVGLGSLALFLKLVRPSGKATADSDPTQGASTTPTLAGVSLHHVPRWQSRALTALVLPSWDGSEGLCLPRAQLTPRG